MTVDLQYINVLFSLGIKKSCFSMHLWIDVCVFGDGANRSLFGIHVPVGS